MPQRERYATERYARDGNGMPQRERYATERYATEKYIKRSGDN